MKDEQLKIMKRINHMPGTMEVLKALKARDEAAAGDAAAKRPRGGSRRYWMCGASPPSTS